MRIYAVEEHNQDQELTKYWLFDELERAQDFVKRLRAWNSFSKAEYIYTFKVTDPQDRE
tara:strand:- start:348 stop:524 length:177 start_codon:yes stop_codon:yes gene_type:complete